MNDTLFFRVWNNVVLFRMIFKYVQLYKKNECVRFNSRKELLEYQEREYIKRIEYRGKELLVVGDLPLVGELKEIEFDQVVLIPNHDNADKDSDDYYSMPKGEAIPYGVEKLEYSWAGNNYRIPKTPISTLPSTVHTLLNANIGFKDKIENPIEPRVITIPSNITELSCNVCPNVSGIDNGNGYVDMSNSSIKNLGFDCYWFNEHVKLRKGDFPYGMTHLWIYGIEIGNLIIDVLPDTLIELGISYGKGYGYEDDFNFHYSDENGSFDVIPQSVEILGFNCTTSITKQSKLSTLSSVKKLSISLTNNEDITIEPYSLPPNLTELSIEYLWKLECNTIPASVTTLELVFGSSGANDTPTGAIPNSVTSITLRDTIETVGILPTSITYLDYSDYIFYDDELEEIPKINQMISNLPNLSSIKLSKSCKDCNLLVIPETVNISYTKK